MLTQFGYPASYLEETPICARCSDTGYIGTEPCECLKKRYTSRLTSELSTILPIREQNFEHFQIEYYPVEPDARLGISPRENMEFNRKTCHEYAVNFSLSSDLLLYGSTGLGKTFLSSCIAKVVSEHGFSVAYDTSIRIFSSYESVKFNSADASEAAHRIRKYEKCDLLIIDDLGTEMLTAFYHIHTVWASGGTSDASPPQTTEYSNTNLLPDTFEKYYSPAIASRLNGEFICFASPARISAA